MKKNFLTTALSLIVASHSFACTTIVVGKKATSDGSILVARNDDAETPDWAVHFILHPEMSGYLFKSPDNQFQYKMPKHVYAYSGMPDWNTHDHGMEEAGLNQYGVAVSATESIYPNAKIMVVDPYLAKTGITESSIPSVILPQIKTAREGVALLGKIIETQGSGEGFGVVFADKNGAWYLENAGGHEWVAVKIPDDSYFVSANQSRIAEVNLEDTNHYLSSPNLVQFATQHGLYNLQEGTFNFRKTFGRMLPEDIIYNQMRVWTLQNQYTPSFKTDFKKGASPVFLKPDYLLSINDIESGLQNHYQGTANDPYGTENPTLNVRPISMFRGQESHVIQLRSDLPLPIANVQYIEFGMSTLGVYLPFYQGVSELPQAYAVGTNQADDVSAYWKFRKLQTLAMLNYPQYAPIVQNAYTQFTLQTQAQQREMEKKYLEIYKGNKAQAQTLLNNFTSRTVSQAFGLTDNLTNQLFTLQANATAKKYALMPPIESPTAS